MPTPTYFVQECPVCGRHLEIRVAYLGKQVVCQHCNGQFQALTPVSGHAGADLARNPLMNRAEQLLERSAQIATQAPRPGALPREHMPEL
jgi:hypothetical protein